MSDKSKRALDKSEEGDDNKLFAEYIKNLKESEIEKAKAEKTVIESAPHRKKKAKRQTQSISIDLHGLTGKEAKELLGRRIAEWSTQKNLQIELTIITGKGRHSDEFGSVLVKEIYSFVHSKYARFIEKIDAAPDHGLIEGLPVRGHFKVWLAF